jgi:hypothetical protein
VTVLENLRALRGVWHDRLAATAPDGTPLTFDPHGGTPGPVPYENLVYIDVDGDRYLQTNVVLRGRSNQVRSFTGSVVDGLLVFDALGPEDPGHVGVSGGPGVLVFLPRRLDAPSLQRFSDPDVIVFDARTRTRITTLYRHAEVVRVLTVSGYRVAENPSVRVRWDPRGAEGPVHEHRSTTRVYSNPA